MAKGFFYQDNSKLVILGDKKKLLAEIDKAIEKAPVKAKNTRMIYHAIIRDKYYVRCGSAIGFSEAKVKVEVKSKLCEDENFIVDKIQVPVRSIEFEIGGGCKVEVFNEKGYLNEFRKRVEKTRETMKRPVAKAGKPPSFRPIAARQEIIERELLANVNRKGWFTDGHLLIKGELPKGMVEPTGKPIDIASVLKDMAYDKSRSAKLQYYYLRDPDFGYAVSRNPVLQFGERFYPNVIFKIDGRYIVYVQGIFRSVKNRYPNAEYRIHPDSGMLVAYENRKPVAGLMPWRAGGQSHKKYPTQMFVPPLRNEAIEAGFLKEKRKALEI